jgi:hypothetical protein
VVAADGGRRGQKSPGEACALDIAPVFGLY